MLGKGLTLRSFIQEVQLNQIRTGCVYQSTAILGLDQGHKIRRKILKLIFLISTKPKIIEVTGSEKLSQNHPHYNRTINWETFFTFTLALNV